MSFKRLFAMVLAVGMLAASGCGSTSDNKTPSAPSTAQSYDDTEPDSSEIASEEDDTSSEDDVSDSDSSKEDPSSKAEESSEAAESNAEPEAAAAEPYVWVYDGCTLTLPASWSGRYIIEDNTVYCKKTHEKDPYSGRLFSILEFPMPDSDISYIYLLGVDTAGVYYLVYVDQGANFDNTDDELVDEYFSMMSEFDSIMLSARCNGSQNTAPIPISDYNSLQKNISGMWMDMDPKYDGAQCSPTVIFDSNRCQMRFSGYAGLDSSMVGTVRYNRNAADYQWNTDNWGDHAIVFLGGSVYKATIYYGAPQTLMFKLVMGPGSSITDSTFAFENDYSALYENW